MTGGDINVKTFIKTTFSVLILYFYKLSEETVSLDSPPPESNPNFGDLLSQVLPEDSRDIEVNNGMPLQQRAPGSHLRNGSITVILINFTFSGKRQRF